MVLIKAKVRRGTSQGRASVEKKIPKKHDSVNLHGDRSQYSKGKERDPLASFRPRKKNEAQ